MCLNFGTDAEEQLWVLRHAEIRWGLACPQQQCITYCHPPEIFDRYSAEGEEPGDMQIIRFCAPRRRNRRGLRRVHIGGSARCRQTCLRLRSVSGSGMVCDAAGQSPARLVRGRVRAQRVWPVDVGQCSRRPAGQIGRFRKLVCSGQRRDRGGVTAAELAAQLLVLVVEVRGD